MVLDTESSLGPYAREPKTITVSDLIKMHGHPCDGLFTAACALFVGVRQIYPDGVIDRTDLCCITNNSPCYGDVASYLTGGRIRFGTQKINPKLKNEWILHSLSKAKTIKVKLRDGVFPAELSALEGRIKSGNYEPADIGKCQKMQWEFARSLLQEPLDTWFDVTELPDFKWEADDYENIGNRGDVRLKTVLRDK
jgi:formylmethanofuran dehydrogenase subunit E